MHCIVIAGAQITVLDTVERYRTREVITIKKHIKIAALACAGVLLVFVGLNWYREASIKQFLSDYYEDMYDGYISLQYVDVSPYLDMSTPTNQNIVIDQKNLVCFRWWTKELKNGYIPTEHKPYRIIINDITEADEELRVDFRFVDDYRAAFPPFILCDPYFVYSCYLRSPGKEGKPYVIRKISNNSEEGRWEAQGFFLSEERTDMENREAAMNFGNS